MELRKYLNEECGSSYAVVVFVQRQCTFRLVTISVGIREFSTLTAATECTYNMAAVSSVDKYS